MVFLHGLNGPNTRKKGHATAKLCCYLNEPVLLITFLLITDYFWHRSWPTQIFCPSLMVLHIIWSWTPWGMYRSLQDLFMFYRLLRLMNEWFRAVLQPASERMNPQRWLKTFVLADSYLCLGFERRRLFQHRPFELLLHYTALVNEKLLDTDYKLFLTNLTPASHSSGTSFINWFALVALFGIQDKFVPNSWACYRGTLPAAVSTGSETTRCCLMNWGICGNYWSFHKAYRDGRDGDRQWTLMNWMLWSTTWNQAVVLDCFGLQQIPNTMLTHTVF